MGMLVDRLPLPSKLPARLVCHWLKGNATFVLCNNIQEPPGVPFVAERDSATPLKLMCVMCGVEGGGGGTVEATVTGPKKKSASPV